MQVCVIIFSGKSGVAGHHYSVRDIGYSLRSAGVFLSYVVVSLNGPALSKPLNNQPNVSYLELRGGSPSRLLELRRLLSAKEYDAYFSFDEAGCRLLALLKPMYSRRFIAVKPGGINSQSWTSRFPHFVCFSRENFIFFRGLSSYRKTKLHYIPNRVIPVLGCGELEYEFRNYLGLLATDRILFAIARINLGDTHDSGKRSVFEGGLTLYKKLKAVDPNFKLVCLGTPKDEAALHWLTVMCQEVDGAFVVTDPCYASRASSLIPMSEALVAMGRTAMEGLSAGKAVFVPRLGDVCPVMITDETFDVLSNSNFTHRADFGDSSLLNFNTRRIEGHFANPNGCSDIFEMSKRLFRDNFDAFSVSRDYRNIIENVKNAPLRFDIILFCISFIRLAAIFFLGKWKCRSLFRNNKRKKRNPIS